MSGVALGSALLALTAPLAPAPQDTEGQDVEAGEVARLVDEYLSASGYQRGPKPWEDVLDRLLLYGDLRLRQEFNFKLDGRPDQHRLRLRFRLGANYELTENMTVGARLATGDPDDPKSNHVTLGSGLDGLAITLDRAFLNWHPDSVEELFVTAGKFNHAFVRNPVYGELVWDADVQPEGALVRYDLPVGGAVGELTFSAGQYLLLENSAAQESYATVLQVSGDAPVSENVRGRAALSYYHYSNLTPGGANELVLESGGNATRDLTGNGEPDVFVSEFGILNPIVALEIQGLKRPLVLSAEYIKNLRANIDRDQGWALGVAAGGTQRKGDWRYYYQWQVVEQDATFSPFAQDDFLFSTNHRSHVAGVNYQLDDKLGVHLWALVSSRDHALPGESTDPQWRVRIDLDLKF